jgi:hypothetical protein
MIVSDAFPGDDNRALKWVQHDAYGEVISHWFDRSRRRFLSAEALISVRTPLGARIEALNSFDHRAVQPAHDAMAAYFRRDIYSAQPALFDSPEPVTGDTMRTRWWDFVRSEVSRLIEEPTITRLLLETCADEREPLGEGKNAALYQAMLTRYGFPASIYGRWKGA